MSYQDLIYGVDGKVATITLNRPERMNALSRNLEAEIIPALRELDIGLVPFSPLGRGFLTGDAKRAEDYPEGDYRRLDPRYQGENFDANQRASAVVRKIAAAKQAKPGQIALAWLLHKGDDIAPIPGTKRRRYL